MLLISMMEPCWWIALRTLGIVLRDMRVCIDSFHYPNPWSIVWTAVEILLGVSFQSLGCLTLECMRWKSCVIYPAMKSGLFLVRDLELIHRARPMTLTCTFSVTQSSSNSQVPSSLINGESECGRLSYTPYWQKVIVRCYRILRRNSQIGSNTEIVAFRYWWSSTVFRHPYPLVHKILVLNMHLFSVIKLKF